MILTGHTFESLELFLNSVRSIEKLLITDQEELSLTLELSASLYIQSTIKT